MNAAPNANRPQMRTVRLTRAPNRKFGIRLRRSEQHNFFVVEKSITARIPEGAIIVSANNVPGTADVLAYLRSETDVTLALQVQNVCRRANGRAL